MEAAGVIETRPIEDDPGAVTLLRQAEPGEPPALAGDRGADAAAAARPRHRLLEAQRGERPGARTSSPRYLGIEVTARGPGHTVARLTTDGRHANPHGTVHGAVFYAVAGAAVAAAANDDGALRHHLVGARRVPPAGRDRRRALRRGAPGGLDGP